MTLKKDPKKEAAHAEENRKENIIAAAIVIIGILLIGWWVHTAYQQETVQARAQLVIGESPRLGAMNASVIVVEFSDFECPFCAQWSLTQFPTIKEQFIDTGQVEFVFKHFPLTQIHGHAMLASQAAVCAHEQGAFWEYHDILYERQGDLEVGNLLAYGEEVGVDMERFEECLIAEETQPDVLRDKDMGISSGVTGTPTFFFNGRKVVGGLTPEEFAAEVSVELEALQE